MFTNTAIQFHQRGYLDHAFLLTKKTALGIHKNERSSLATPPILWAAEDQVGEPFPFPEYGPGDLITVSDPGFQKGCPESPFECPLWFYADNGPTPIWYTCVNNDVGDYWAEWVPDLVRPGLYAVAVFIPDYPELTTTTPKYTIYYNYGSVSNTGLVNQFSPANDGGYWVYLGNYFFNANGDGKVRVTNATGEINPSACDGNPVREKNYYGLAMPLRGEPVLGQPQQTDHILIKHNFRLPFPYPADYISIRCQL